MALIAFCAIALVEKVTNAHPVGRAEERRRRREGWRGSGREEGEVRGAGGGGKTRKNKNRTKGLDTSLL